MDYIKTTTMKHIAIADQLLGNWSNHPDSDSRHARSTIHFNKTLGVIRWTLKPPCVLCSWTISALINRTIMTIGTVSPRGHLFYVDFLFFIFTSHRGGNVSTAVRTFPPR